MSGEKKFWPKLRSPFRGTATSGVAQEAPAVRQPRSGIRSGSRVSSVYLSDDSSTHGFVVVPEFDPSIDAHGPVELVNSSSVRSFPTQESSDPSSLDSSLSNDHSSDFSELSPHITSTSPDGGPESSASSHRHTLSLQSSEAFESSHHTDRDLDQRLDVAYDHIHRLQPPVPQLLRNAASSDPLTFRKQLGMHQHSVIYRASPSMPRLPNPHTRSPLTSPPSSYHPIPPTDTSRPPTPPSCHHHVRPSPCVSHSSKPSLHINTNLNVQPSFQQRDTSIQPPCIATPSMAAGPAFVDVPTHLVRNIGPCADPLMARSPLVAAHVTPSHQTRSAAKRPPSKLIKHRPVILPWVSTGASAPASPLSPIADIKRVSRSSLSPNAKNDTQSHPAAFDLGGENRLPAVRPPSPFILDMPTHQSWHNRLTNFEHSSVSNSYRVSASIPTSSSLSPRVSASTDALASLAWIGAPSLGTSASTPSFTSGRGDVSVNAIRGDSHLSMAMAVDDHDISDDVLVEKLEKIRRESSQYEQRKSPPSAARHTPDRFQNTSLPLSDHDKSRLGGAQPGTVWAATPLSPLQHTTYSDFRSPQPAAPAAAGESDVDPDDASIWQAARKALLCVREILRTERKYQEALKSLLDGQTLTQPPDLMLGYLPGLLQTSETLLKGFIDDPSAWGVSTAFISSEDDLETAMVSWCAVAGNFFVDRKNGEGGSLMGSRLIFRRSLPASSRGSPVPPEKTNEGEPGSPLLPPMLTLMNEAGSRIKERQKIDDRYWRRSVEQGSTDSHGSSCRDLSADETHRKRSDAEKVRKSSRRLSVRDLAIQPTQRVMRYVLLYRDLLESTPATSPSRALVERALEAASRIAEKCDRAQNNVAFIPRRA